MPPFRPHPWTLAAYALSALLLASTASAALSPQYEEWRNGPVQWIMTGAEKSAWKKVATDDEAVQFIDLFWARRDPTPGTPQNEVRDEHDSRVTYADKTFKEPRKRGSLTDRGRVWVVLGTPPNYTEVQGRISNTVDSNAGGGGGGGGGGRGQSDVTSGRLDPSGGRQMGARSVWIWEHADASKRFGMPRVEIVFVTDPINGRTIRDVFRRDYGAAEAVELKKQIVEDYKELPSWAAFGGLTPRMRTVTFSGPAPVAASQPPASATVPAPAVAAPVPVMTEPRGATRLTLTARDVFQVDPQTGADPFAKIEVANRFKTTQELGWAAQYCGQADQELSVPFIVRISGNGVDLATPLEEVVPDRIKSSPGCYMLRGAIPLDAMAAGKYTLQLLVDDPIVKSDSYDLKHDFTIE
jgi:GWxTD domain-containing protein